MMMNKIHISTIISGGLFFLIISIKDYLPQSGFFNKEAIIEGVGLTFLMFLVWLIRNIIRGDDEI